MQFPASSRCVGIEILTNGGDANRVGFSELAVTGTPTAKLFVDVKVSPT